MNAFNLKRQRQLGVDFLHNLLPLNQKTFIVTVRMNNETSAKTIRTYMHTNVHTICGIQ